MPKADLEIQVSIVLVADAAPSLHVVGNGPPGSQQAAMDSSSALRCHLTWLAGFVARWPRVDRRAPAIIETLEAVGRHSRDHMQGGEAGLDLFICVLALNCDGKALAAMSLCDDPSAASCCRSVDPEGGLLFVVWSFDAACSSVGGRRHGTANITCRWCRSTSVHDLSSHLFGWQTL